MNQSCSRRIQFCSGHRVLGHENKCAHLHGHNYVVWFHARSKDRELDSIGRVIDFSVLKEKLGSWIDMFWDHGMILFSKDPLKQLYFESELLVDQKFWIAPFNPTAEEMATYLLKEMCPMQLQSTDVEVWKVELWETENCKAEAQL